MLRRIPAPVVLLGGVLTLAGAPAAAATVIDFDQLPAGASITTQYPGVTFSSIPGYENVTTAQSSIFGTSPPNFLCTATSGGTLTCAQPTFIDFAPAIENLKFLGVGINDTGTVATVNVFKNGVLAATVPVTGAGTVNTPVPVDLTAHTNITRIEITNITDGGGAGWDDFSFVACPQVSAYGQGCPADGGFVPVIEVDCGIQAGGPTFLSIYDAPGGVTAVIFFGLQTTALPMGSGCDLLVAPLLPFMLPIPMGGAGPGAGSAILAGNVPPGTTGVQFTTQVFVPSPQSPVGFGNSRGQLVTIG